MNKPGIFLLVASALMLGNCKRDFVPPILQCEPGYTEGGFRKCDIVSYEFTNQVESPTFNPNNADEFAYVDANRNLVKYNMATKEKGTLVDNLSRILTPDWGAGGWIVFSAGWKIWRIGSDGSGLKQLSFNPRDLHPKFDPSGAKLIYPSSMDYTNADYNEDPSLRKRNNMKIIDINGVILDSLCSTHKNAKCYPWDVGAWSPTEDKLAVSKDGITLYDSEGSELAHPYDLNEKKQKASLSIKDIEWHPTNGLIYFQDGRGIKTVGPDNGKVRLLKKTCADESYGSFTISGDGEHIIAIKREAWKDRKNCAVSGEYYFVRMNSNGAKEERIFIPPV